MANVLVYKNADNREMSPGHIMTPGENNSFDTVTERWYYGNGIKADHAAGNTRGPDRLSGGSWICMGVSDMERLPGGAIIGTVTWRGLLRSADGITITETRGIRETTYDAIDNIPGAPNDVQGRILDPTVGLSLRAITKNPATFKPVIGNNNTTIPGVSGVLGLPQVKKIQQVIGAAAIYTYPYGWICYSWQAEEPLPGIFLVSAEYRYEHQVIFA